MNWKKVLENASVQSFKDILSLLAAKYDPKVEILTVSIYLRNGQNLSGTVLKVATVNGQEIVMLHQQELRPGYNGIFYVLTAEIVSLGFQETDLSDPLVRILTGGKSIEDLSSFEPISKLNFQRFLRDQAALFTDVYKDFTVEVSDFVLQKSDSLGAYKFYITLCVEILKEIKAEEIGREALTQKVQRLFFEESTALKVQCKEKTLYIAFSKEAISKQQLSEDRLKDAIEDVL
ncbi:MAG: hypothetical protein ACFB0B_17430 [Thermonemataceae bacterium]